MGNLARDVLFRMPSARLYGKCSKITNTKKIIIFLTVRNFRNCVSEKVLVFVILECGLYQEQKRYICM